MNIRGIGIRKLLVATAVVVLAAQAGPGAACLNETGTNRLGQTVYPGDYVGENLRNALGKPYDKAELRTWARPIIAAAKQDPSYENLNDLAVVLVRYGNPRQAVDLLQFVERKSPGHFETAANLGTALEVAGRDADALRWIREGIRRNPKDHGGTEWLHVRILEAKLAMVSGRPTTGLDKVLGLDFGAAAMPRRPARLPLGNDGKPVSLFGLAIALRLQLWERMTLVSAPDPVVASLVFDWANLELDAGVVENSVVLFDFARAYGFPDRALLAARRTQAEQILAAAKGKPSVPGKCEICFDPDRHE